jgi:nitroreductase
MNNQYFKNRHTVRAFAPTPITDDEISSMLDDAQHAPNTGNMQWYSAIVTRDANRRSALAKHHFNQPAAVGAPVIVTFCLDLTRFERWCRLSNAEPGFENFQSLVAALIDTTIFAQQFVTVAELKGYGTCYLGTVTYNAPEIARELELPERVVPVAAIALGVPASESAGGTWRLPISAIMHTESYREPSDNEILEWYSSLEQSDDSKAFVRENNKSSLAQVFTDVRYPKTSAEHFSDVYYHMLVSNHFINE